MVDRQYLDNHKQSLQNDLNSHLTPHSTPNNELAGSIQNMAPTNPLPQSCPRPLPQKHHALFDSLKAPMTAPKKSGGSRLTQTVAVGPAVHLKAPKKEDTDSAATVSTTATANTVPVAQKVNPPQAAPAVPAQVAGSFRFDFGDTNRVLNTIEHITNDKNGIQRTKYDETKVQQLKQLNHVSVRTSLKQEGTSRNAKRKREGSRSGSSSPNRKRIKV